MKEKTETKGEKLSRHLALICNYLCNKKIFIIETIVFGHAIFIGVQS